MISPMPTEVAQSGANDVLVIVAQRALFKHGCPCCQAAVGMHGGDIEAFLHTTQAAWLRLQGIFSFAVADWFW